MYYTVAAEQLGRSWRQLHGLPAQTWQRMCAVHYHNYAVSLVLPVDSVCCGIDKGHQVG
jgi:hypothetical protein